MVIGGLVVLATVLGVARGRAPGPASTTAVSSLSRSFRWCFDGRSRHGCCPSPGACCSWTGSISRGLLQTGGPFSPLGRCCSSTYRGDPARLVPHRPQGHGVADVAVPGRHRGFGDGHRASRSRRTPDDSALVAAMTIAALWAIAFSTATFSAINERALRRQNAQLARLAAMTEEIDGARRRPISLDRAGRASRDVRVHARRHDRFPPRRAAGARGHGGAALRGSPGLDPSWSDHGSNESRRSSDGSTRRSTSASRR